MSYSIAGSYLEACNCDAICPCRRINGHTTGRSTHGICYGVLSWRVDEGRAGEVDLTGSRAAMAVSYDDDEPGSPWTLALYVDGPGELADVLLGRLGGDHVLTLPWVRKPNASVEMRTAEIEIEAGYVRVGHSIRLRATRTQPMRWTRIMLSPGLAIRRVTTDTPRSRPPWARALPR